MSGQALIPPTSFPGHEVVELPWSQVGRELPPGASSLWSVAGTPGGGFSRAAPCGGRERAELLLALPRRCCSLGTLGFSCTGLRFSSHLPFSNPSVTAEKMPPGEGSYEFSVGEGTPRGKMGPLANVTEKHFSTPSRDLFRKARYTRSGENVGQASWRVRDAFGGSRLHYERTLGEGWPWKGLWG